MRVVNELAALTRPQISGRVVENERGTYDGREDCSVTVHWPTASISDGLVHERRSEEVELPGWWMQWELGPVSPFLLDPRRRTTYAVTHTEGGDFHHPPAPSERRGFFSRPRDPFEHGGRSHAMTGSIGAYAIDFRRVQERTHHEANSRHPTSDQRHPRRVL
jgi:hypothetical protein